MYIASYPSTPLSLSIHSSLSVFINLPICSLMYSFTHPSIHSGMYSLIPLFFLFLPLFHLPRSFFDSLIHRFTHSHAPSCVGLRRK